MSYTITRIKEGIANGTEIPYSVLSGSDSANTKDLPSNTYETRFVA